MLPGRGKTSSRPSLSDRLNCWWPLGCLENKRKATMLSKPIDIQPGAASAPHLVRFGCPVCGAADDYTPTIELRGSFSWTVFFAGGLLAVLFRNAGRRKKVRCNKCDAIFNIRTPLSKVSLVIFWLLICPTIITLIIFFLSLLVNIFSS